MEDSLQLIFVANIEKLFTQKIIIWPEILYEQISGQVEILNVDREASITCSLFVALDVISLNMTIMGS